MSWSLAYVVGSISYEDDAPAPARAYRGTTSLAAGPTAPDGHSTGYDGPHPPGSSEAATARSSGSSPVIAGSAPCAFNSTARPPISRTRFRRKIAAQRIFRQTGA